MPKSFFDQVESDLQMNHIPPLLLRQYAAIMGVAASTAPSERVMRMFLDDFTHGTIPMLSAAVHHIPRNQLRFLADDLRLIRRSVEEIAKEIPVSGKDETYRHTAMAAMDSLEKLVNDLKAPK